MHSRVASVSMLSQPQVVVAVVLTSFPLFELCLTMACGSASGIGLHPCHIFRVRKGV